MAQEKYAFIFTFCIFTLVFQTIPTNSLFRRANPSSQIVEFDLDPNDLELNGKNPQETSESKSSSAKRIPFNYKTNLDFVKSKNEYRAESYALSALAGIKNSSPLTKLEIQLGFISKNPESRINEVLGGEKEEKESKGSSQKKLVCYYNVPTMNDAPFPVYPEQIDPNLCTHIIVGFARVYNYTIVPNDPRDLEVIDFIINIFIQNI